MMFLRRIVILSVLFVYCIASAHGQDKAIGSWQSYLPYNSALGVATNGNTLYVVGNQAFFTFDSHSGQIDAYSKIEGMSDIGMQGVGYDMATGAAILVYANGNIDVFKDNTFYNIPDLKLKTIAGEKAVYEVYTLNGYAYLSTSLGVIVINLSNQTIKETYQFNLNNQVIPVKSFIGSGNYFYAVTTNGVYRAAQTNPGLQNFQVWRIVDTIKTYKSIKSLSDTLFLATANAIFKLHDTTTSPFYTSSVSIHHIDAGFNSLFVSEYADSFFTGKIRAMDVAGNTTDSFSFSGTPWQVVQTLDSSLWIAEGFGGLLKHTGSGTSYFTPAGPLDANAYDMHVKDGNLWVAHGGITDRFLPLGNASGIANLQHDKWTYYTRGIYQPFDTLRDFTVIDKDETDGTIYTGSFGDGLFILKPDGGYQLVKGNSIYDPSQFYYNAATGTYGSGRQVAGIAIDRNRNVWTSTISSAHQLYVKTADSVWYSFIIPGANNGGPVLVDDNDQVWFISYGESGGVSVLNHNGTIADKTDDATYHLNTGVGFGNLPSNKAYCMAKDNNNNIWIGTSNGIGIVNSCQPASIQSAPCDAQIPIVQYDKYAGYLFAGNNVRTIAVDGANRKWVGTDDGVWLLSSDASKIIYRFTVDNSPLPSNHIQKIAIDPVTGFVYIGTEQGLVSYRSTATEGGTTNSNVMTYPNPVPPGYSGTIAIKGLVANGDVRITDINGQLVYRTKALGGQAVWNGLDYTGRKPQSGVYLIFVASSDGNETYTGKMVFLK